MGIISEVFPSLEPEVFLSLKLMYFLCKGNHISTVGQDNRSIPGFSTYYQSLPEKPRLTSTLEAHAVEGGGYTRV
jgi:hypothetical protein